jgi:chitinase
MRHQVFSGLKWGWFSAATSLVALAALLGYMASNKSVSFFSRPSDPFHFSPYLDLNLAVQTSTPLANTYFSANTKSSIQLPTAEPLKGFKALTLAFASGACGQETWGGMNAQTLAKANVVALQQANVGYMISTGGVDAMFTCSTREGMATFIDRYRSSHLLGFDFNIEAQQTETMIQSLVQQVGIAMDDNPTLRFSFTLAAIGAGDSHSLNRTGQWVMKAIEKEGLKNYYINLMVMNYGKANLGNCIVRDGQCDMTASAIRAVNNLSRKYHLPLRRIEVTPMIGINDETSNVFTLEDAQKLAVFAQTYGLGGLHFWSLNRDTPCAAPTSSVFATCNSLPDARKLQFTEAFAWLSAPTTEAQVQVKQ